MKIPNWAFIVNLTLLSGCIVAGVVYALLLDQFEVGMNLLFVSISLGFVFAVMTGVNRD